MFAMVVFTSLLFSVEHSVICCSEGEPYGWRATIPITIIGMEHMKTPFKDASYPSAISFCQKYRKYIDFYRRKLNQPSVTFSILYMILDKTNYIIIQP